jgi:hypothetical protein
MAVGSEVESTWKWLWLVARFCPCHCLERLGITQNPLICDSRCRGRDLNQAELELKKAKDFPHHAMQTNRGRGGLAVPICNLDTRWRWMINIALPPEGTPVAIALEAGWAPELICTFLKREKSLVCTEIRTPDSTAPNLVGSTEYCAFTSCVI